MRPLARRPRWRMWIGVSIVMAVAAVCAPPAPATTMFAATPTVHGLDPGIALDGSTPRKVIVSGAADVVDGVRAHGGVVTASLSIVHGVAAVVPAGQIRALASDARVASVTADRVGKLADVTYDASGT